MITNLQLLRGLAALAVVFYHTAYTFNGGVHTDFQAVSVFFVISGFIMTYITRVSANQFLPQRLIRIVPLYWLCTLLPLAGSILKGSGRMWADSSLEHIAESLLFIPYQNPSGDFQPLLAVGWTLNLEMFFYVLFAAALLLSRRFAPLLVCAALIGFKLVPGALGCTATACVFYAHDYTSFLILGVGSYYVWRLLAAAAAGARWIMPPIASLAVVIFVMTNAHPPLAAALQAWTDFPPYLALPPVLVTTVLLLHSAGFQCKWRPLLLLGDASYALYVTHTITMEFVRTRILHNESTLLGPDPSILAVAVVLLVCVLVAIAVFVWLETPMLKTLRTLLIRRGRFSGATQSAKPAPADARP